MAKKEEIDVVLEPETQEEPARRIEIKNGERVLAVRLTEDELLEQGRKMAEASEEAEQAEADQKSTGAHYKAKAEEARGKARAALTLLRNGYDYRSVKVTLTKDWDTKRVTVSRDDTGEIIEARDMTAKELQIPIPGTSEEQKPEVAAAEPEKAEENPQPEQPAA